MLPIPFNTTLEMYKNLARAERVVGAVSVLSISIFVYLLELILVTLCIVAHKTYLALCLYKWKAKSVDQMRTTHMLFFVVFIGCVFKIIGSGVLIYKSVIMDIGPELTSLIFTDLAYCDIGFSTFLMIYMRLLVTTETSAIRKRAIMIFQVIIVVVCAISVVNTVYAVIVFYLVTDINTMMYMIFLVPVPYLLISKVFYLIMAIAVSVQVAKLLCGSDNKRSKFIAIKVGIGMVLSVLGNIIAFALIIAGAFAGLIPITVLFFVPNAILYAVIIIMFFPSKAKLLALCGFCKCSKTTSTDVE